MKIKELRLKNFGKFTNKEIHFSDGMNVIYGENESGKSTLYTFIRAMLRLYKVPYPPLHPKISE